MVIQEMVVDGGTAMMQIPFERLIHVCDSGFSYMLGVLDGMQVLVATADQKHCNLPDVESMNIARCAVVTCQRRCHRRRLEKALQRRPFGVLAS